MRRTVNGRGRGRWRAAAVVAAGLALAGVPAGAASAAERPGPLVSVGDVTVSPAVGDVDLAEDVLEYVILGPTDGPVVVMPS